MAINTRQSSGRQYVYLSLMSNCKKHLSPEQLEKRGGVGEAGFRYKEKSGETMLTRSLSGHIASARLGEDSYQGETYPIATFKLVDGDTVDEIVTVRLDNSLGRNVVGLAVAAVFANEPLVDLYVSQIRHGEKFAGSESVASKDMTFVNAKNMDTGEKLAPMFLDAQGEPLSFPATDGGEPRSLPEGKKARVNGKEVWDFSEHIDIAKTSVRHLEVYFKQKEVRGNNDAHDEGGDHDGIDPTEAARAAAAPAA